MLALAAFSLLALVSAQSTGNASTTDIEDIEANFEAAQLVPNLLSTFTPQGTLSVNYAGSAITIGQNISQADVGSYPSLTVKPSSNATDISASDMYTIILADGDIVGTDEANTNQTRHWLINGASLSGAVPYAVNYTGATTITDYTGPGPAAGSGSHRYVLLMYAQPSTFTAPSDLSAPDTPLGTFSLSNYVSSSGLGPLVAANYFQVENGVATATVSATSAVNTATLAGAAGAGGTTTASGATASASGSSTKSASASGSRRATGSATSAATASSTGAAGRKESFGWGAIVGGIGVVGTVLVAGLGL